MKMDIGRRFGEAYPEAVYLELQHELSIDALSVSGLEQGGDPWKAG
jgi:hypothetical protein